MFELRDLQKEIIPIGLSILKKHYMVWLTGQERAGKTLPALGIIDKGGFGKALCITTIKAGIDIKKCKALYGGNFELDIINYESAHKMLSKANEYRVVWLDESHKLGQAPTQAKVVKTVKLLCQGKYVIYSTATPSAEGYYKLFHQFYVSSFSPFGKYKTYYQFAKDYVNLREVWRNGSLQNDWTEIKWDLMWPVISHLFITWTREDAGFIVDAEDVILKVKMSDESIAIYNKLKKDKIYEHNGRVATISGGAQLLSKLNQIGSGTLKYDPVPDGDNDGVIHDYSKADFIKAYFHGRKIAIFYKYVAEGKLLRQYFPNHTDNAADFNSSNDLVFIGQVKSFCEGVDLSSADCLVNYNIEFSATVYSQSRARLLSLERTRPAPVYFIFPEHGIDDKIYQAVSNKKNFTWTYYANEKNNARKRHSIEVEKRTGETRVGSVTTH